MKAKLVAESLEEMNEGKFGRAIGGAALGAALAFGSPQQAQAQEPTPTEQTQEQSSEILGDIYYGMPAKEARKILKNNSDKFTTKLGGIVIHPYDIYVQKGLTTGLSFDTDKGTIKSLASTSNVDVISEISEKIKEDLLNKGYEILHEEIVDGFSGSSVIMQKGNKIAAVKYWSVSGNYQYRVILTNSKILNDKAAIKIFQVDDLMSDTNLSNVF